MKYKLLFPGLLLAMLAACTREPAPAVTTGRDVNVEFRIGVRPGKTVTRAAFDNAPAEASEGLTVSYGMATRALGSELSEEEETAVNNLWILQYDESSQLVRSKYIADGFTRGTDGSDVYYSIPVPVRESGAGVNNTLFLVANAGADAGFASAANIAALKAMNHAMANESAAEAMVMSGRWSGEILADSEIRINIERVVSKLSINILYSPTADWSMVFSGIKMRNVAKQAAYYDQAALDGLSPWLSPALSGTAEADAALFDDYAAHEFDAITGTWPSNNGRSFWWYVPENRRGMQTDGSITTQKDKWRETDPSWNGTRSYSTYVEITGLYTDNVTYLEREIVISLYPGDNETSDFDVVRNADYEMNVTLRNIDTDDKRIEVSPYVTVNYHYEDPANAGSYIKFATAYHNRSLIDASILHAGHDFPDYTADIDILNSARPDIPASAGGDAAYEPGLINGTLPTTVSADNSQNVIDVYYDQRNTGENKYTVTFIVSIEITGVSMGEYTVYNVPEGTKVGPLMMLSDTVLDYPGGSQKTLTELGVPIELATYIYKGASPDPFSLAGITEVNVNQDETIYLIYSK